MEGRTVFVIAHRLSTVRNANDDHGTGAGEDRRERGSCRTVGTEREILSALSWNV